MQLVEELKQKVDQEGSNLETQKNLVSKEEKNQRSLQEKVNFLRLAVVFLLVVHAALFIENRPDLFNKEGKPCGAGGKFKKLFLWVHECVISKEEKKPAQKPKQSGNAKNAGIKNNCKQNEAFSVVKGKAVCTACNNNEAVKDFDGSQLCVLKPQIINGLKPINQDIINLLKSVKKLAAPFFCDDIMKDPAFDLKVQKLQWEKASEAMMLPRIARGIRLSLFFSQQTVQSMLLGGR